jgi:ADP-heptose:LPS heptosyltransferase
MIFIRCQSEHETSQDNYSDTIQAMKLWKEANTWQSMKAADKFERIANTEVHKIVVIKHAAFGDLLLLRPFLVELRKAFPVANITLSVISHYLRGIPDDLVDNIHIVPSSKEKKGIFAAYKAYKKLGSHDLLFDLTASTRSFILSRLTKANFKIGFQYRSMHKFIYDIAIPRSSYQFEAGTFLEQLCPLGIAYEWPPRFAMKTHGMKRDKPYIVYFPTASTPDKSWSADNFTDLVRNMAAELTHYEHIILSGISEWEKVVANDIMARLSKIANVTLLGAGPEDQELIKGATLLVSNDTGIRHLGIAMDTTTVCIFFSSPPYRYWPRYGQHQVVYNRDGSPPDWQAVASAIRDAL